ncbi:DUF2169 domain-containing protein [Xenorhabdus griffiniae]|uniref:DUF2169 family type VI secretion system accessory protein n=1 Tax=Xenorhabdus griffiniae TaxID=351672 RepID=UPI0030D0FC8A
MEFRNLTPFAVMNYSMLDVEDAEHHVVVMKTGYQWQHTDHGHYIVELLPSPPLCLQDEYFGSLNRSSVKQESDLAPFKPHCDIILTGTAHAPNGIPCPEWPVSLRLTDAQGHVLLDKTLLVCGEREFIRRDNGEWQLTAPAPCDHLPLDYRYAFGGECKILADETAAQHLHEAERLTPEQRRQHPDGEANAPLAHAVCEQNPLGRGFITPWYARAHAITRWPAPRLTQPNAPFTAAHFAALLAGTLPADAPSVQPQGMGFIGRPWLPRRTLAGTYDDEWLAHRHPYLPNDFDFGYWNGAPADQQIDWPAPGLTIHLSGVLPQHVTLPLPAHRPFLLLRMHNGVLLPVPMRLDTLLIDSDTMTVHLTHRLHFGTDLPVRVAEARFEMNPDAPLLKLAPREEEKFDG